MSWNTAYRSFYYQDAPEPEVLLLPPADTASEPYETHTIGYRQKEARLLLISIFIGRGRGRVFLASP